MFKERVSMTWTPNGTNVSDVLKMAYGLLSSLFYDSEGRLAASLAQFDTMPFGCHGPGAVFDSSKGSDKWHFDSILGYPDRIYRSQHGYLPQGDTLDNPSSRLAIVPKDFRKHRLICVEPKEFMFYQQGLMRVIVDYIHNHWLTRGAIDFNDQSKSFRLSRSASCATIDLSDASDNLRLSLARLIFPRDVLKLATRARSRRIVLPDGEEVSYTSLFTMGNGLCFPFQTIIFYSLTLAAIIIKDGSTLSDVFKDWTTWQKRHRIRVFGDDIIVPKRYFESVKEVLSECGLKVNHSKSCCDTPFREACGSAFFYGEDVRCVRLKNHTVQSDQEWCSVMQSAKLLCQSGFTNAGHALLLYAHDYIPVPWGVDWVPGTIPWGSSIVRWNVQFQRVECRVPIIKDNRPDVLNGEVGLYNYFVGRGSRMAPHHSAQCTEWGWTDRI